MERAFRELKSGLDLRPVYHWTEKRIRGHVMVCFLALVLEMAPRRKLAALGEDVPYLRWGSASDLKHEKSCVRWRDNRVSPS